MLGDFGITDARDRQRRPNSIGYHAGSRWVDDTATCVLGMARQGHAHRAALVATKLLDVGEAFDCRLIELVADSATIRQWAPCPASCCPHAWAVASSVALLTVAEHGGRSGPPRACASGPPPAVRRTHGQGAAGR
jgi:glycogen debranching enzyme